MSVTFWIILELEAHHFFTVDNIVYIVIRMAEITQALR